MIYMRGNPHDFDQWAFEEGNDGWSFQDCLPYFEKLDAMMGPPEGARHTTALRDAFLEAGLRMGYPILNQQHSGEVSKSPDKTNNLTAYKRSVL